MQARLQRRVQRYGWDLAAGRYDALWREQLAPAQAALLAAAAPSAGESVIDVCCGTGTLSVAAARAVGAAGRVVGTDLSEAMVEAARRRAATLPDGAGAAGLRFERSDAESLAEQPDAGFDLGLCALGLMYLPDPAQALRELHRVVRPGGRIGLAVWGERARCGWAPLFGIVDAEVASEVCPLFFALGQGDALARLCATLGFGGVALQRLDATLAYPDAATACDAAFAGGPVALAWSRFDAATRERVRDRYRQAIEGFRDSDSGYRIPGEFVIVTALR